MQIPLRSISTGYLVRWLKVLCYQRWLKWGWGIIQ